jgi:hypothetical protein
MAMKYDKNNPLRGFYFYPVLSGAYLVHYQSDYDSRVGRHYEARIEDMTIIDATRNAQNVKKCDVDHLRRLVKAGRCVKY